MTVLQTPIIIDNLHFKDSKLEESFNRLEWYHVLMIWLPITSLMMYRGLFCDFGDSSRLNKYLYFKSPTFSLLTVIIVDLIGLFLL